MFSSVEALCQEFSLSPSKTPEELQQELTRKPGCPILRSPTAKGGRQQPSNPASTNSTSLPPHRSLSAPTKSAPPPSRVLPPEPESSHWPPRRRVIPLTVCPDGLLLIDNVAEALRRQSELPASSTSAYQQACEMDVAEAIKSATRHVADHLATCPLCRSTPPRHVH